MLSPNRRILQVAGLTFSLIATVFLLVTPSWARDPSQGGGPIDPPFEILKIDFQEVPAGLACENVVSAIHANNAYRSVQKKLANGAPPKNIPYLGCFLPNISASETAEETLVRFKSTVFLPNVLYGFLVLKFEDTLYEITKQGQNRRGDLAWLSSHYGQTALAGFMSTGEKRFLDIYISFFDRLIMLSDSELGYFDDYHEQSMSSWGSTNLGKKPDGTSYWVSHVTHFSSIMIPATGFAREINSNPELKDYLPWADKIFEYFDLAYRQFDTDLKTVKGTNKSWYWRPIQNKYEATNHLHLQGEALLNVYAVTGNPVYKKRIKQIIRIFEKGVTYYDDGTVSWHYSPYFQVKSAAKSRHNLPVAEYSWKGALTVPFLFAAEKDGLLNNSKLIDAIMLTTEKYIIANNQFNMFTHPVGAKSVGPKIAKKMERRMNFGLISGYHYIAAQNSDIPERIIEIVASQPENFVNGWLGHQALARSYGLLLTPEN